MLSSGEKERINEQAKPRRSSFQPDFSFGFSLTFLLRVAIFKRFIYVEADFHPCRDNNHNCTTVSTVRHNSNYNGKLF